MNVISIIPARLNSSRFPSKPMKKILGIMWHPERYKTIKQKDINLTKHFLKI